MSGRQTTFTLRLGAAASTTLQDHRLLWFLVAIFGVRRVLAELPVFMPAGADVFAFIYDGHRALTHPDQIYPQAAALLARGFGFVTLYPPPQLVIAAVYALPPDPIGAYLWVATNTVAAMAGLVLLLRNVRKVHPAAVPIFWLIVVCFTPLFEDLRLGQRGGVLLLLGVGSMSAIATRPVVAGALAGLAAALKFYPGAMVLGVDPRRQWTYIASLGATAVTALAASFIPFGSPIPYFTQVLAPSLTWRGAAQHDCFQNSTQLLYARLVGGESYGVIDEAGNWRTATVVPWHFGGHATALTYLTIAVILGMAMWAVWRSNFVQPYALAICFSLGTLVPAEVFTYQFLPMLPLLVLVFMKALQKGHVTVMVALAAAMWTLLVSPCALPFPSLWTVAALFIFAVAVYHAPQFRQASDWGGGGAERT